MRHAQYIHLENSSNIKSSLRNEYHRSCDTQIPDDSRRTLPGMVDMWCPSIPLLNSYEGEHLLDTTRIDLHPSWRVFQPQNRLLRTHIHKTHR